MAMLMETRLLIRKVKDLRSLTPRRGRVKEKWVCCHQSRLDFVHGLIVYVQTCQKETGHRDCKNVFKEAFIAISCCYFNKKINCLQFFNSLKL